MPPVRTHQVSTGDAYGGKQYHFEASPTASCSGLIIHFSSPVLPAHSLFQTAFHYMTFYLHLVSQKRFYHINRFIRLFRQRLHNIKCIWASYDVPLLLICCLFIKTLFMLPSISLPTSSISKDTSCWLLCALLLPDGWVLTTDERELRGFQGASKAGVGGARKLTYLACAASLLQF
jgi:hypothetical protein